MNDRGDGDWRLRNQERHLVGLEFVRRTCSPPRADWDHDHCEFCSAKFAGSGNEEVLREGFCTPGGYWWVCPGCFEDFRDRFGWTVKSEPGDRTP